MQQLRQLSGWCVIMACLALLVGSALASILDEPLLGARSALQADADRIEFDRTTGRLVATGNAIVRQDSDELRADRIVMDTQSGIAHAIGRVTLTRASGAIRADQLSYHFESGRIDLDEATIKTDPYIILADTAERLTDERIAMRNARISTCELAHEHWHYHIRARRIEIMPDDYFKTYHAVWRFGRVPVFYMPYWKHNLDADRGFHLSPGFTSRWGAYLLTAYRQPLNNAIRLEHQVDMRSERGFAIGEQIRWNHGGHKGDLHLYFLDDQNPRIGRELQRETLDAERYRIQFNHRSDHTRQTYSLLRLETTSDAFVRRDFFERDFRSSPQPVNLYSLTHRSDRFSASALVRYRLDPFYNHVNRLPELSIDVMRQQLGDSSFYYESRSAAAWLEQVWARGLERESYSTLRAHTDHTLYWPQRYFGWLNVTPRVGYQGTYYADTVEGGDAFRSIYSAGLEASYKAYRIIREAGNGLRHMAEPYMNYTYVHEPDVLPEALLQFDRIDRLRDAHVTRVGMRNKLQTRRNDDVFDLVDLNIFADVRMEPIDQQRYVDFIHFRLETEPVRRVRLRTEGRYNIELDDVDRLQTNIRLRHRRKLNLYVEHRYIKDSADLIYAEATVRPSKHWDFNAFGRYSIAAERMEEQGFYVQRNYDCLSFRTGISMIPGFTRTDGTEREDEYRFRLELWLTAFPEHAFVARSSYYGGGDDH